MKKTIIIANWKMNPQDPILAARLGDALESGLKKIGNVEVVICPPFIYIPLLKFLLDSFKLGAQDCFWEQSGAFTGEISAAMLKSLGCEYVILGHSERKNYLGETHEMINKKVKAALQAGLIPVVCIGEKERRGATGNKGELEKQMREVLNGVTSVQAQRLVLTYEPEWAISSNKGAVAARPEDSAQSFKFIRDMLKEMFGDMQIPLLYGGSTTSKNIKDFIDAGAQGALVGSASLNANEFIELVKNAGS